jgi:hypothetical protein
MQELKADVVVSIPSRKNKQWILRVPEEAASFGE